MVHFEARCCRAQRAAAIRRIATKFSEDRQQAGLRKFASDMTRRDRVTA
jgi:hypothetical protein